MQGFRRAMLLAAALAVAALTLAASAQARPGDLDPTYGSNGLASRVATPAPAASLVVDAADRPLALGRSPDGLRTTVRRATTGGTLDTTFGDSGTATVGEADWFGAGLAVQPDGRILVLAVHYEDGNCPCAFRLYRLLEDGQGDPSLDGVQVPIQSKFNSADLQVTPSGRILVPGDRAVVGLTADGAVDPGFGEAGVLDLGSGVDELERDPTGGYLVGWTRNSSPNGGVNVAKVDGDGALDSAWGDDGVATPGGPGPDAGADFALAPSASGRVAVGATEFGTGPVPPNTWLFVLDSDGEVAADFDPQPALNAPVPPQGVQIGDLDWDEAGRLLMAGGSAYSNFYAPWECASFIARFQPDGSPDGGFGQDGLGVFPGEFSSFPACALTSIARQSDGRILAAASPAVARFVTAPGGTADADADGVVDAADDCPRRFSQQSDGCQRATVKIALEPDLSGTVAGATVCSTSTEDDPYGAPPDPRPILLFRERRGGDELVGRTKAEEGRFEFGSRPKGNTYYARMPQLPKPGIVVCSEASSPELGLLQAKLKASGRQKAKRKLHAVARCKAVDCKLRGRAIVKLRRPGRKNLKLRSRRVKGSLDAGERQRLSFKLKRRDAKRMRRSVRRSRGARKRSRVVFRMKARKAGQSDRARAKARLRR